MLQRKDGIKATAKKHDKIPRKFSGNFISPLSIINKTHVELSYFDTKGIDDTFYRTLKAMIGVRQNLFQECSPERPDLCSDLQKWQNFDNHSKDCLQVLLCRRKCLFLGYTLHPLLIAAFNVLWSVLWMPQYQKQDSLACTYMIDKEDMNFAKNFLIF